MALSHGPLVGPRYVNVVFPDHDHLLFLLFELKIAQLIKIVSLTRKYNNHKLQTNQCHREEEPHNNHKT